MAGDLIGSLIASAGNVAGGFLSQPDSQRVSDLLTVTTRPRTDPVLGQVSLESLLSLGSQGFADALRTTSPLQQVFTEILENPTIKNKTKRRMLTDLETVLAGGEITGSKSRTKRVNEALALSGFGNIESLRQAEQAFQVQLDETVGRLGPIADSVQQGRVSALEAVSFLQQDFLKTLQG